MGHTQDKWTQDGATSDLQIFVGASEFKDVAGFATFASSAAGLFTQHVPATDASTFFANVTAMLKRTGVYATPLWSGSTANAGATQEAFGTAASVAGPTTVSGTSGPLALQPGVPPQLAATLGTLATPTTGAPVKGMEITSIDVIYEVNTLAASAATVGVTDTVFTNGAAPTVTNRIALGANSLPTAVGAGGAGKPYVKNVAVGTPAYPTSSDTETVVNVNLTAGATGTCEFYGVVLYVAYNLN